MPIFQVIFGLIIIGLVWYLIETYVPIAQPIKVVIYVVAILFLCMWLLQTFGMWSGFSGYRVGPR